MMGQDPSSAARSARKRAMSGATVLCATCVGAGSAMLDEYNFTRVLIDEAAQATELASVVALTRGCKQLALVGDHCQHAVVGTDVREPERQVGTRAEGSELAETACVQSDPPDL